MALGALAAAYSVTLKAYSADGPSMEPALGGGDRFFILRSLWAGDPEPGDVVVVQSPADGLEIIKRVIAVGGQTVEITNGRLRVDGRVIGEPVECPPGASSDPQDELLCTRERLGSREWITVESSFSIPATMDAVAVPDGRLFVMGDHRDRSNDSRNPRIGTLAVSAVRGVVIGL